MRYRRSKLHKTGKRITDTVILFLLVLSFFTVSSCNAENTVRLFDDLQAGRYDFFLQANKSVYRSVERMGKGSAYYVGLHLKQAGYDDVARFYFNCGVQYNDGLIQQLCRNELYNTGKPEKRLASVEQRLKTIEENTSESAVKEKILLTDLQFRLLLHLKQYDAIKRSPQTWYSIEKLTPRLVESLKEADCITDSYSRALTDIRIAVFEKNYTAAWKYVEDAEIPKHTLALIAFQPVLSAIGKAAVYGSSDKKNAVALFEKLITQAKIKQSQQKLTAYQKKLIFFYANFYAARVYSRAGKPYLEKAADLFYHATAYAVDNAGFDTALWYYLDTLRSLNRKRYVTALEATAPLWKNPAWYRDLIEDVLQTCAVKKDWNGIKTLHRILKKIELFDQEVSAGYILARSDALPKESAASLLDDIACSSESPLYYRFLAAYHREKKVAFVFRNAGVNTAGENADTASDRAEYEAVLDGLIRFGLSARVYRQAVAADMPLSAEKAAELAGKLASEGLYTDSMRIAVLGSAHHQAYSDDYLRLLYPRPWKKFVEKYAAEYNVPEYLLYALIRSESFFNASVASHAGAYGLTQLMPATASDVARKLKIAEYDLSDPETNIRFGAYYLSEMIRRSDNRIIPACCAYNAGITQVRRWQKRIKGVPEDLFLECLPFEETRGYGKKIFKAAAVYAYLYYNKSPEEVADEFFSF